MRALIIDYVSGHMAARASGVSNFVFQFASQISPAVIGALLIQTGGEFTLGIWLVMAMGPALGTVFAALADKKIPGEKSKHNK